MFSSPALKNFDATPDLPGIRVGDDIQWLHLILRITV